MNVNEDRAPLPGDTRRQKAREADGAARHLRQDVCDGLTKSGVRCKAFAMAARAGDGRLYCASHHPAISSEERLKWAKRGGLVSTRQHVERKLEALTGELPMDIRKDQPDYKTAAGTRAYLEKVSAKVEHGEIAPSQAGAIAQLAGLAIKLAELQNERDLLDMELEAARDRGGRR